MDLVRERGGQARLGVLAPVPKCRDGRAQDFLAAVEGTVGEARLFAPDPEQGRGWEVQCRQTMVPTYAAISETERRLADIAETFEGYADGWGTLSNPDGSPAD